MEKEKGKLEFEDCENKPTRGGARPNTGNRYGEKVKKVQLTLNIDEDWCELNGGKKSCTTMLYKLARENFKNK